MKYTIFQIDDSRQHYVDRIRSELLGWNWDEIETDVVDGRNRGTLLTERYRRGIRIIPNASQSFPRAGHLGIWYTVLNAIERAPIVTIEDDAILMENLFGFEFQKRVKELPDDADFFSLFLPRDSDHMFKPRHEFGAHRICRAYQPYGGVSMYYTERGRDRIFKLLDRDGITDQYDNQLYRYSWHGELNGYTSKPVLPDLVRISGTESSIVQESEII